MSITNTFLVIIEHLLGIPVLLPSRPPALPSSCLPVLLPSHTPALPSTLLLPFPPPALSSSNRRAFLSGS